MRLENWKELLKRRVANGRDSVGFIWRYLIIDIHVLFECTLCQKKWHIHGFRLPFDILLLARVRLWERYNVFSAKISILNTNWIYMYKTCNIVLFTKHWCCDHQIFQMIKAKYDYKCFGRNENNLIIIKLEHIKGGLGRKIIMNPAFVSSNSGLRDRAIFSSGFR